MFDNMFSFFGGLASKAKSKIIEKALQPIIDYNFENIFEQKIAIKDLNKGITNVKLNTKYINGMLKTNTLKEFQIKFIKLEKLQLQMSDVEVVLDLNTKIQQEEVLESLEVENLVNQSVHMQMEQLKKEFLCENSDSYFSNEIKTPIQQNGSNKTSSKTVMFLRIIDNIFGNIKIDIKNLRIKFVGKLNSNKITSFSFFINKINCSMQKPQNTNQILFLGLIDQIKLYLDDTKQIGQMDNALKLDVYLKQDTEPKITIQASQFQIIVSLNQLDQIMQLFAQSAQVLEQRENTIKEVLRFSNNLQQIRNSNKQQSGELSKIINLNKYKLEEYFKKSYHDKIINNQEYFESTFIVQDIPDSKITDLYISIKQMSEQKEFLVASFQGLTFYITSNETDQQFNYQQRNFKIDLENYYSVSLCDIKIVKHKKLNIFINSLLIYELQKIEPQFSSTRDFIQIQEQDFVMIGSQKFLCKIIIKTGKDQFFAQELNKELYQIEIQEPTIFASQTFFVSPIKIEIKDKSIVMDITQFNLIVDKNQLQFIMKILNIYTQNSAKPNNQGKSETQFKISKTKFSIFYHVNSTLPSIGQNYQTIDGDYIQLDFIDFFLSTPEFNEQNSESGYQYKSQFKFGCQSIWGLDKQIQIHNLNGYFGSQLQTSTSNIKKFNEENKSQITQYLKECKLKQEQHLELQIESVILNHNSFDQFYRMISQLNLVFNDNSKQTQNNQKKQQNFYFCTKIKIIEVTLYQTMFFCFNHFKYYFTIDYQFILLEDLNGFYKNNSQLLLMNQVQDKWIFNLIMKQNKINLEFSALKLNLTNFNFDKLISCITQFINSIQFVNPPVQQNKSQNEKSQVNILFKQIMIDILPFYNEEIILQKKGQAKLNYSKDLYQSWTRSILVINNAIIKQDLIKIEEIQHYFQNCNTANRNDELINLNEFQNIGQIQKIELFKNKFLNINSIQFFRISKQIIADLIDHYEHISKDFQKNNNKVDEKKNYQKLDKIEMKSKFFEICCDQLSITNESQTFELIIYYTQLDFGQKCFQLKLSRAQILDRLQQSKFKYILDEEDLVELENFQSELIKERLFLDLIIQFDQDSLALCLQLKPIRICLSGYQTQELLKSFQTKNKEINTQFKNEDDDECFEIIQQKKPFNLQVELFPIQFIVSFDSEGLDVEGLKTQVLKFGSFNNLILATNEVLYFHQFNQTSKQDFIQFLKSQQLSTFGILLQAYSSLEITKAASSFTDAIVNMVSKPFISNNGFLYGLIEGSYDLTCGITSSLLQLTALPASALNNMANYIGLGVITVPFSQLEEFCKKLFYKINPEKGIPQRFLKDQQ
ncbi:unnamed protein product [Paramecium pentaurelia]|uniref:Uncharacterized protein n=1 Tax=Paramecium pentaurelia TaxID=43138 RepID=A0A8S1T6B2_9CILI|nr:unnamed protein product [Paramecium pentaurelia]